jgi:hypothetical protein
MTGRLTRSGMSLSVSVREVDRIVARTAVARRAV